MQSNFSNFSYQYLLIRHKKVVYEEFLETVVKLLFWDHIDVDSVTSEKNISCSYWIFWAKYGEFF
uniref:Uncharacterized protein n=1 Tax=Arundo donax TaxID=35708 RepID=A0A0A9FQH1_ARUDO